MKPLLVIAAIRRRGFTVYYDDIHRVILRRSVPPCVVSIDLVPEANGDVRCRDSNGNGFTVQNWQDVCILAEDPVRCT